MSLFPSECAHNPLRLAQQNGPTPLGCVCIFNSWSRRKDLNAPSADYNSDALPLSYAG